MDTTKPGQPHPALVCGETKVSELIQRRQQRRTFLKAAGVSIALPSMESLAESSLDAGRPAMRMVCIASALGMNPEAFFPTSFDANFALSSTL